MQNQMFTKTIGYDIEINLSDINESNFKLLSRMSPFGLSNYKQFLELIIVLALVI